MKKSGEIENEKDGFLVSAPEYGKDVIQQSLSLQYLSALNSEIIFPLTLDGKTRGGCAMIVDPRIDKVVLKVFRFIGKFRDGSGFSVQDEVMFPGKNDGLQLNFEFDSEGKPVKFSKSISNPLFSEVVSIIKELSTVEGAIINAREGSLLMSNGEAWVQISNEKYESLLNNQREALLGEGNLQLEENN